MKHLDRNGYMQLKIQITALDDENQSGALFNSMLAYQDYILKMQYIQWIPNGGGTFTVYSTPRMSARLLIW